MILRNSTCWGSLMLRSTPLEHEAIMTRLKRSTGKRCVFFMGLIEDNHLFRQDAFPVGYVEEINARCEFP